VQLLLQWLLDNLREWKFIVFIRDYQRGVHFRKGLYLRTLDPGWWVRIPYVDDVEDVTVVDDVLDLPVQSITTKDGHMVSFSANIAYEIVDVHKMYCRVQDFETSLSRAAMNHLARKVRDWTWDELMLNQRDLEKSLRDTMTTRVKEWGVKVLDVGLTDLVQAQQYRVYGVGDLSPLRS
jgi:regulator of protease activity HflC (stomatin/prohibitin superfamily)